MRTMITGLSLHPGVKLGRRLIESTVLWQKRRGRVFQFSPLRLSGGVGGGELVDLLPLLPPFPFFGFGLFPLFFFFLLGLNGNRAAPN